MKNVVISLCSMLLLVGCATISPAATAKDKICAKAEEYVEGSERKANASSEPSVLEAEVESCGLIANTGLGYATYHINGYSRATGQFLGHMKRMIIYVDVDGAWFSAGEDTLIFLPPTIAPSTDANANDL